MRIESFLSQSPIFQANRIARRMDASLGRLLAEEGLTVFESLVLAAIFLEKNGREKRGDIQPSELAEAFQTTRGNVSHCISSLEAKGLVARRIDPDDARAFRLMLKPQGRRSAVRVVAILDRMQRQIEASFGAGLLAKMLEQMATVEGICANVTPPKT